MRLFGGFAVIATLVIGFAAATPSCGGPPPPPPVCTIRTVTTTQAFCETFTTSGTGTGSRSGQLNSTLWGVSRARSYDAGTGGLFDWHDATMTSTCGTQTVTNLNDVQICAGQMVEAVNDGGTVDDSQSLLAAYPRQPFDFAGRTGTISFDVSNDTEGDHAAWPVFTISDQPTPAPYSDLAGLFDSARNSIGVEFSLACQGHMTGCDPSTNNSTNVTCVGVDKIFTTSNYVENILPMTADDCVSPGSATAMNHVEIQYSATDIKVFMSDAGNPASTRQIAHTPWTPTLTRGLVWFEDVHYNANKFNDQANHTFAWDNLAFDGPVLPRDLGYDVLDNTTRGSGYTSIGYSLPHTFTINNVTNTAGATAALFELTYWPESDVTLSYQVNGGPVHSFPWPFGAGAPTFVSQTAAMPVPLSELHDGTNTITMTANDALQTGNYDLILAGAG